MRLYVSGPMTGYPDYNFPTFHATAEALRVMGHEVWSPAEMDEEEGIEPSPTGTLPDPSDYARFLARDIQVIAENQIEGIVVIPGWHKSGGAKTEVAFARALKLPVYRLLAGKLITLMPVEVNEGLSGRWEPKGGLAKLEREEATVGTT